MSNDTQTGTPVQSEAPVPAGHIKAQLFGTWLGLATFAFFFLSFVPFSDFLPPMDPSLTKEEVQEHFKEHTDGIRLSMIFMNMAGALFVVLITTISTQIKRIRDLNPLLHTTILLTGAVGSVLLIAPGMVMTAAVYRPERPLEVTYMMYDLAWLLIIMPVVPFALMAGAIGLAMLSDPTSNPVFPRWLGYFNIWVGILFLPGLFVTFFKDGPMAWNGVFAFWVPAAAFGAWFIIMFVMLRKAIRQQVQAPA